jgi:hypothetical protein
LTRSQFHPARVCVTWYDLLVAGRIDASPEAAARADDLFAVRPQAFCGSFF